MAEVRGEVHFANEPLAQQAGGHLRVEHFDRHPAMRVLLHRQEDPGHAPRADLAFDVVVDRKSTRLNSSHLVISYAVFCLKKKNTHDSSNSTSVPSPGAEKMFSDATTR